MREYRGNPHPPGSNLRNMDYKDTLNLPKTDFPMKANLPKREPQFLEKWEKEDIYHQIRKKSAGCPKYVLHDGPPYANGHIHLGTALNKILKDIIVKSKTMMGYDSPYIPGWDCHGLPIEHKVELELKEQGKSLSKSEIRRYCRAYAEKYLNIQRDEFKRLGVFGDWQNPYMTMSYNYEAITVREFGKFVEKGSVAKRLKSVRWCISCETALAEAEVEYDMHTSPSVYVKFPLASDPSEIAPELAGKTGYVVIWTTTPWTLPANLAIAFHPDFEYVAVEYDSGVYIFAEGFLNDLVQRFGWKAYTVLARFPGSRLEGLNCRHPFIDRQSKLILADYVTLDQGTGCVHTAPGHGQEDYETGLQYGLDIYSPVDGQGKFTSDVEHFAGMNVFKANQKIIELMQQQGCLMASEQIEHQYPHCWRCKNPVIFRATAQWFILMDCDDLRKRALENIKNVRWIPDWGEDRIYSMIENRPDWCISRQRVWGVPIVACYCNNCGHLLLKKEIVDYVADKVEQEGTDVWFDLPESKLLPPGTRCEKCGSMAFTKEMDILDVWFDSGVSHAAVCEPNPELTWPVDMYLEGSDQHRGWFHSTLLASVGTRGVAPYKTVLTHGYTVDSEGKKMSKSLGNIVAPEDVINQYGAEVLRLWVACEDYRTDITISNRILEQLADAYRRIRNTCRYLLGNLYEYDPATDAVPYEKLLDIDKWALHRLQQLIARIRNAYEDFEFHIFYHAFHNFCVVDMSAFYLDVLKDRMYTAKPKSLERRSGQTAMYEILSGMVKLMAPILTFTAEEVWQYLAKDGSSVHLEDMPAVNQRWTNEALDEGWSRMIAIRDEILKRLEIARKEKLIGHSLDALVQVHASGDTYTLLREFEDQLASICIVSQAELFGEEIPVPDDAAASETVKNLYIRVTKAYGDKCPRCWQYRTTIGENAAHPEICAQCAAAIS
jgi:isoleucyl-tRNA synthetase